MTHYLFLGYLILYALVSIVLHGLYALIVPREEKAQDPPWETPLDLVSALVAFAGMLLLYLDVDPPWLIMIWKPVSVLLVVSEVYRNVLARFRWFRSPEAETTSPSAVRATDLMTLFLLLPALVLNLVYAFGS